MARTTPITKDWLLMGFTTGVLAAGCRLVTNIALDKIGVPTHRFASVASGLFLGKKRKLFGLIDSEPKSNLEWGIGYAGDLFLGGLFGAGLTYIMTKTPPGNELYKGALKGTALGASTLVAGKYFGIATLNKVKPNQLTTMMLETAFFGSLQGWILGKYGSSMITESHPVLTKPVTNDQFFSMLKHKEPSPMEYH